MDIAVTADGHRVWVSGFVPVGMLQMAWISVIDGDNNSNLAEMPGTDPAPTAFQGTQFKSINNLVSQPITTAVVENPPCAPGKIYDVIAKWKNQTTNTIWRDITAVSTELAGKNVLVGQTWDLTPDGAVGPGETFTGTFRIKLSSCSAFRFFVTLLGATQTQAP